MKVAIVLLVCCVAMASATSPSPTSGGLTPPHSQTSWLDWAKLHKEATVAVNKVKATPSTGPAPTTSYIISDAGSGGTRMIIGVKGVGEITVTGLTKIVTPDSNTPPKPAILEAFKQVMAQYPDILFVALGATAGARNDMWVAGTPDVATRIGTMCAALKPATLPSGAKWECNAGIIQGTTEGFLGWYDAWRQESSKPSNFCYMEFGGMSTQIAASTASGATNVDGSLNGQNHKVGVISGMQLGFNVLGDSRLNTAGNSAAAKAITDCDVYDTAFTVTKCTTAVQAFLAKDTALADCLTNKGHANQIKTLCSGSGKTLNVREGAPWTTFLLSDASKLLVPSLPSTVDFSQLEECKVKTSPPKNTGDVNMPWFGCGRLIMWNEFFKSIFGTSTPTLARLDNIEWFNGFKAIMVANKFDGALMDVFMKGNGIQSTVGHAVSDCVDITGTTGFPLDSTRQRLRLRSGRKGMHRVSSLRLKF